MKDVLVEDDESHRTTLRRHGCKAQRILQVARADGIVASFTQC